MSARCPECDKIGMQTHAAREGIQIRGEGTVLMYCATLDCPVVSFFQGQVIEKVR